MKDNCLKFIEITKWVKESLFNKNNDEDIKEDKKEFDPEADGNDTPFYIHQVKEVGVHSDSWNQILCSPVKLSVYDAYNPAVMCLVNNFE
jgi:hypothetical protein